MISLESVPEPHQYIFTVNGTPRVGSLSDWAHHWEMAKYGADVNLSDTVLTWDDTSDPITWKVLVDHTGRDESDFLQYKVSLLGHPAREVAWVSIDGRS